MNWRIAFVLLVLLGLASAARAENLSQACRAAGPITTRYRDSRNIPAGMSPVILEEPLRNASVYFRHHGGFVGGGSEDYLEKGEEVLAWWVKDDTHYSYYRAGIVRWCGNNARSGQLIRKRRNVGVVIQRTPAPVVTVEEYTITEQVTTPPPPPPATAVINITPQPLTLGGWGPVLEARRIPIGTKEVSEKVPIHVVLGLRAQPKAQLQPNTRPRPRPKPKPKPVPPVTPVSPYCPPVTPVVQPVKPVTGNPATTVAFPQLGIGGPGAGVSPNTTPLPAFPPPVIGGNPLPPGQG